MTEETKPGEEPDRTAGPDVNDASAGRVDWSPLSKLTGTRLRPSKYGLTRYSPLEWRTMNAEITTNIPSAVALDRETKHLLSHISNACDKQQNENTLWLRQRAVDITAKNIFISRYQEELRAEIEQLAQSKTRMYKAIESLETVEGINAECREIRKNRFEEDLVRDNVEEELFQEMGLCQEIKQLYEAVLEEFERHWKGIKACHEEVQGVLSDQKETLDLEAENIGLKSSSNQISFVQGNARLEKDMSSTENWEEYLDRVNTTVKETLEFSKAFRRKISILVLSESAKVLRQQDEKVIRAFLGRIGEVDNARMIMETELENVLKEIAHAEDIHFSLTTFGRKIDFNLKVVQTRLENRRHRPGVENCRDKAQFGLLQELKVVSERVTALQTQMSKVNDTLNQLNTRRKLLQRQIHVKRHSLMLDQERCMRYRTKYPNNACLLGY